MKSSTDKTGNYLEFISNRTPNGPVSVSYTVPAADPSAPNGRGPHREMIVADGGITTSGAGILLLPPLQGEVKLRLHWKLPKDFEGVSSFGEGDVTTTRSIGDIQDGFYFAGKLKRFPSKPDQHGLSAYGLGNTDINLDDFFSWTSKDFEATRHAFSGAKYFSIQAFYRSFEGGPLDSGRASPNGILLYIAPTHEDINASFSLKKLMAHEMIHVFQPQLDDFQENLWFTEGAADYLSLVIPFEAGLVSAEDYHREINAAAIRYYGNSRINTPNHSIPKEMWAAPDAWMIPYSRGAFYFADLDARVRKLSEGKTTAVDLINELGNLPKDKPRDRRQWREIVVRHAGENAGKAFDAMLSGRTIFPVSGAFGKCMTAEKTTIGKFDLLYAQAPNTNEISFVKPDSNAARAGLRVGDQLAADFNLKPYYSDTNKVLDVKIKRDEVPMTISYVPRFGSVEARVWKKNADNSCRDMSSN